MWPWDNFFCSRSVRSRSPIIMAVVLHYSNRMASKERRSLGSEVVGLGAIRKSSTTRPRTTQRRPGARGSERRAASTEAQDRGNGGLSCAHFDNVEAWSRGRTQGEL